MCIKSGYRIDFAAYDNRKKDTIVKVLLFLTEFYKDEEFPIEYLLRLPFSVLALMDKYIETKYKNSDYINANIPEYINTLTTVVVLLVLKWSCDIFKIESGDVHRYTYGRFNDISLDSFIGLENDILSTLSFELYKFMPEYEKKCM